LKRDFEQELKKDLELALKRR